MLLLLLLQEQGNKYSEVSNPSLCQHCLLCNITISGEIILPLHQHSYTAKPVKPRPSTPEFEDDAFTLSPLAGTGNPGLCVTGSRRGVCWIEQAVSWSLRGCAFTLWGQYLGHWKGFKPRDCLLIPCGSHQGLAIIEPFQDLKKTRSGITDRLESFFRNQTRK